VRITLSPTNSNATALSGILTTDVGFECYFLTLPKGDGKPGSAIPPGTYPVTLAPSPKFIALATKQPWFLPYMNTIPHVNDIPGRSNILIHVGNTVEDTDGCILVGLALVGNMLANSRKAFATLHDLIAKAESTTLVMVEQVA
jgi:hypothetical protein